MIITITILTILTAIVLKREAKKLKRIKEDLLKAKKVGTYNIMEWGKGIAIYKFSPGDEPTFGKTWMKIENYFDLILHEEEIRAIHRKIKK